MSFFPCWLIPSLSQDVFLHYKPAGEFSGLTVLSGLQEGVENPPASPQAKQSHTSEITDLGYSLKHIRDQRPRMCV